MSIVDNVRPTPGQQTPAVRGSSPAGGKESALTSDETSGIRELVESLEQILFLISARRTKGEKQCESLPSRFVPSQR